MNRMRAVVRREALTDDIVSLVSDAVGKAIIVERSGLNLWHKLGQRVPGGGACGGVGVGSAVARGGQCDRD